MPRLPLFLLRIFPVLFLSVITCFTGMNSLFAQSKPVKMNTTANNPEEVTIAINPRNPKIQVAASNINNFYYSSDGGHTWKERSLSSRHGYWGDPMLHFDADGNLFIAHLGKNPEKFFPTWIDKMVVQRINYSGDSCFSDASIGYTEKKIQDKEWLSSDAKNLYLTWTEFDKYESRNPADHSRIYFSQSADKGKTWTSPLLVSDTEGDCLDGDSTMEGATSCTDSKGTIYVCWSGINRIWFDKSTDGGKTFGTDQIVTMQHEGWEIPVNYIYRSNGMPFVLCNSQNNHYRDRIYINWSDTRNGDADVFVKYSDDGGKTWSRDIRVNNDALANRAFQFSNNMAIDPATGFVYVIFYDTRNSNTGSFIDVYIACSKDGGETWKNVRVTPQSFPAPGKKVFFGDYIDIDAVHGIIRPAYTANVNNALHVYTALLDTLTLDKQMPVKGIQAAFLNDSLFIHLQPHNRSKYTLTVKYNRIEKTWQGTEPEKEFDVAIPARGIYEARITYRCGVKKQKIKLVNAFD